MNLELMKKKSSNKQLIKITISLTCLICILYVNLQGKENQDTTKLTNVGYVYENNELVTGVTKKQEQEKIKEKLSPIENSNITYTEVPTLLDYEPTINAEEFVNKQAEEMIEGYTLSIDNNKYYTTDKSYIDNAKEEIYSALITDSSAYSKFMETGEFESFTKGTKTITDIKFENEIAITQGLIPKAKVINSSEEFLFDIIHSDEKSKYYTITDGDTVNSIIKSQNIAETDFYMNNPKYQGTPILETGDQVIVNKINPVLNIAVYSEETKEETIPFPTTYKETDSLDYGEKKTEQEGVKGLKNVTYKSKVVNGKKIYTKDVNSQVTKQATEKIILKGKKETDTSGQEYTYSSEAGSGEFIWPMSSHSVSCGYGCYSGHEGIDITGPYGANVYTATSGKVIYSQYSPYGGGYECRIYYNGMIIVYAHMKQQPNVSVGQTVAQGQQIGYMGSTGNVTGPHLHFEVRTGANSGNPFSGSSVNSRQYLP